MSAEEKIVIRLYTQRDADLLTWFRAIPAGHGAKSIAVKSALRKGLAGTESKEPVDLQLDAEMLLETLLPPLRRLVDNAIRSAMANVQFVPAEDHESDASGEENIDDQLDALGTELMN
jgi:hypothetical protein